MWDVHGLVNTWPVTGMREEILEQTDEYTIRRTELGAVHKRDNHELSIAQHLEEALLPTRESWETFKTYLDPGIPGVTPTTGNPGPSASRSGTTPPPSWGAVCSGCPGSGWVFPRSPCSPTTIPYSTRRSSITCAPSTRSCSSPCWRGPASNSLTSSRTAAEGTRAAATPRRRWRIHPAAGPPHPARVHPRAIPVLRRDLQEVLLADGIGGLCICRIVCTTPRRSIDYA